MPLEFHSHCTIGLGPFSYLEAAQTGAECLHTSSSAAANGTGQPAMTPTIRNLRDLGLTVDVDDEAAQAVWAGVRVYATSVAPYFASAKGRMLGISGAIAAAIHNATGTKAVVFGKPEVAGLDMVAALTGEAQADMAVIGDDPKLEITMARRAGAFAIGVTTGIAELAAFNAIDECLRAHHVIASLEGLAFQDWFTK